MFVAYVVRTCDEREFAHYDTFAAYLQVWADKGYAITWPFSNVAYIGGHV